ncbi:MAG: erythromycin esterase family protein [Balneolaceae bacterium]
MKVKSVVLFGLFQLLTTPDAISQQKSLNVMDYSVVPVESTSEPFTQDFKDFLKKELAGIRVLALGESSHEDGATFVQKTELVKLLHQEFGFTVLAFEYGFYGHWLINEKIKSGQDLETSVKYAGWSRNKQSFPVYEYIYNTHQTGNPLKLAGFDGEKVPDGVPNISSLVFEIGELTNADISQTDSLAVDSLISSIYGGIGNKIFNEFTFAGRNIAKQIIQDLKQQLQENAESLSTSTDNEKLRVYDLTLQSILMDEKSKYAGSFWNIVRDKSMYERVTWLADSLYKNEKIILWGASAHFARNMVQIERKLNPGDYGFYPYYPQGDFLHHYFGNTYYSIAFTAGSGRIGTVFPDNHRYKQYEEIIDVPIPDTISYEGIALKIGKDYLFTTLRNTDSNFWLDERFVAYPLGYNHDTAKWKSVFDGIYFIREMRPIDLISRI